MHGPHDGFTARVTCLTRSDTLLANTEAVRLAAEDALSGGIRQLLAMAKAYTELQASAVDLEPETR